ncbi:MAG: hypothetical protein JWM85_1924 [Acidimicrobiaceae bacterium]|nr:hypothetical protein [Acidimicrobiaceae bacterium]
MGVDLGGTRVRIALARPDGTFEAEADAATLLDGDAVGGQLLSLIRDLSQEAQRHEDDLAATVLGVPGVADNTAGVVRHVPNVPALERAATITALRAGLAGPLWLENDVNLAALAEWHHGGHTCESVAALALGTGIGLGIVVRGELLRGDHLAAGEIADLPFGGDPFGALGFAGALESVVSGSALVSSYQAATGSGPCTAAEVFASAARNDAAASEAVDRYAHHVARSIIAVLAILDPGVIALTGSIGADPYLLRCVNKWLDKAGVSSDALVVSRLGARAGLIGAVTAAAAKARATAGAPA